MLAADPLPVARQVGGAGCKHSLWAVVRGWDLSMADLPRTRMGSRGWLIRY